MTQPASSGLGLNVTTTHVHHVYLHFASDANLSVKLDHLANLLETVIEGEKRMSAELDALAQQVAVTDNIMDSAITLIQGLAQQIQNAGTDPAKLQALTDDLMAKSNSLAAAIQANSAIISTPAPTPAPTPEPTPTPAPTDAPVPAP